jgi:hypothetical protein
MRCGEKWWEERIEGKVKQSKVKFRRKIGSVRRIE